MIYEESLVLKTPDMDEDPFFLLSEAVSSLPHSSCGPGIQSWPRTRPNTSLYGSYANIKKKNQRTHKPSWNFNSDPNTAIMIINTFLAYIPLAVGDL